LKLIVDMFKLTSRSSKM